MVVLMALEGCYMGVIWMLQGFFKVVLMVSVTRMFQGCFKGVSRLLYMCYEGVSWAFHGS